MQQTPIYALTSQSETERSLDRAAGPAGGLFEFHTCVRQYHTCTYLLSVRLIGANANTVTTYKHICFTQELYQQSMGVAFFREHTADGHL